MIKIITGLNTRKGSVLAEVPEIIHGNNSVLNEAGHYRLSVCLSQLNKNNSERSL